MLEKSENFNSLRPILFELCKKKLQGGQIDPPPPAGIGLKKHEQKRRLKGIQRISNSFKVVFTVTGRRLERIRSVNVNWIQSQKSHREKA